MKIIASTIHDGFLLEASKDELLLLLGFRNSYSDGFKSNMIEIGKEIPITKIATVSRFVRTLEKDRLLKIKKDLESAITDIDEAVDTTQEITLFATLSEEDKS